MIAEQQASQPTPPLVMGILHKILYIILYGSLLGLGSMLIGSPSHNLWSVRYLWQQAGHPLTTYLPAVDKDAVPADHRSGHLWQARALLAAGQLRQAEALLQPLLVQGDYDAQRLYAELLATRGDLTGAVTVWARIGAVDDLLSTAQTLRSQGQIKMAIFAYRTVYELAPERTVLPLAGVLWREVGEVETGETLLRQYIIAMPTSRYWVSWLRELATLYRQQQAWAKAITIYEQLLAAAPDSTQDRVQLGWLSYEEGAGVNTAMSHFQQAVAIAPQDGDGYYAIASLLSREKQFTDADPWYAQALEREPAQQWWWLSRASAAQQAGNLALAMQLYETAQKKFPNFVQAYYQAAWVYQLTGDRERAVSAIETAIALLNLNDAGQRRINADVYARAGQIYEWVGDLQQAVYAYKQAAALEPERQGVQDSLRRLYGEK